MWTLHRELQANTIEQIFDGKEQTTANFLAERGFSQKLIHSFFKPFFTGIFLETELKTSSRMFKFVFKMFGLGFAVIPKGGIGAMAEQLAGKLKNTTIYYESPVQEVQKGKLLLRDGREVISDFILVATDPSGLVEKFSNSPVSWRSCDTLYFEVDKRSIKKPMIGLVADRDALINNLFYPTSISTATKGGKELLSVTVVREHNLDEKTLVSQVEKELKTTCRIEGVRFLRRYQIRRALPVLQSVSDNRVASGGPDLFFAGDHLMYGSSNAALSSGEKAAQAILERIEERA